MGIKREQQRQGWKKQVELWQASGMSALAWCRQHNLAYQSFLYWKRRLAKWSQGKFVEVKDGDSNCTGISIESQGLTIQLARDFDTPTLQRLLRIVRRG